MIQDKAGDFEREDGSVVIGIAKLLDDLFRQLDRTLHGCILPRLRKHPH